MASEWLVLNANNADYVLFEQFKEPLLKAGMNGSLSGLLEQWHGL